MRILATNDDGVAALGLQLSAKALTEFGEVFVVAPESQRSACGHSITLHKPLRMWPVDTDLPLVMRATNGQPADCVTLGYTALMEDRCDLVVSGINSGPNLGWDLTYSGTVSAAMEGAIIGISSLAVSLAHYVPTEPRIYDGAVKFIVDVAPLIATHPLPPHTFLNVNVPNLPVNEIKGLRVVKQGTRQYVDRLETREDPWGQPYYWLGGKVVADATEEDTDVQAIAEGYISVTPIQLDLTTYEYIAPVREWLRPLL